MAVLGMVDTDGYPVSLELELGRAHVAADYYRSNEIVRDAIAELVATEADDVPAYVRFYLLQWFKSTTAYRTAIDDLVCGDR
jgi:hypothetical protein